uniref:SFRICE_013761 n=1 Tax=Spodoptera frugiperda TaxID=7108 RepID=A0A2H1VF79_SPOFR
MVKSSISFDSQRDSSDDVAASTHAAQDEESLCDPKLVELFCINGLECAANTKEILRVSGFTRRSPATVSVDLRTASKGSSPPDQNQTRAYGASRSARGSKSLPTTEGSQARLKPR